MKNHKAAMAYAEQVGQARQNVGTTTEALEAHVARTGAQANWGHVGDLVHLNELLADARRFIRNEED